MNDWGGTICWCVFWISMFGGCVANTHFERKSNNVEKELELKLKQEETKRLEIFGKMRETP